jgi:hypothetical protein
MGEVATASGEELRAVKKSSELAFQLTLATETRYSGECLVTHCTVLVEQSLDRGPLPFVASPQSSARPPDNRAVKQPGLHQCSSCAYRDYRVIHRHRIRNLARVRAGGAARGDAQRRGASRGDTPVHLVQNVHPQTQKDFSTGASAGRVVTKVPAVLHNGFATTRCMASSKAGTNRLGRVPCARNDSNLTAAATWAPNAGSPHPGPRPRRRRPVHPPAKRHPDNDALDVTLRARDPVPASLRQLRRPVRRHCWLVGRRLPVCPHCGVITNPSYRIYRSCGRVKQGPS